MSNAEAILTHHIAFTNVNQSQVTLADTLSTYKTKQPYQIKLNGMYNDDSDSRTATTSCRKEPMLYTIIWLGLPVRLVSTHKRTENMTLGTG